MNFGQAIALLKAGHRVARAGWNGKGMWLALTPGSAVPAEAVKPGHALSHIAAELPQPTYAIGSHIDMRAADGTLVVGWLASQTDMLADDWQPVTSGRQTLVTPILIEANTANDLREAGYEVKSLDITADAIGIPEDGDGIEEIEAWEPERPEGEGWILHHKGWIGEDGDIAAVWARPLL